MATATAKKPAKAKKTKKTAPKRPPNKREPKYAVKPGEKPKPGKTTHGLTRKRTQTCGKCERVNTGHNARNCPSKSRKK